MPMHIRHGCKYQFIQMQIAVSVDFGQHPLGHTDGLTQIAAAEHIKVINDVVKIVIDV